MQCKTENRKLSLKPEVLPCKSDQTFASHLQTTASWDKPTLFVLPSVKGGREGDQKKSCSA